MKKLFVTLALGVFILGFSQSDYYNDYRRSVTDLNWETVAANLLLTQSQKDQLIALNNRYPDYDSWNRAYGKNPENWRNDRYNEMRRILGDDKYYKFKNKYYKGQNPVAVYNRNKNNDMRYKHLNKKAKVYKVDKKEWKENKWKGNNGKSNGKGKAKGHK